MRVNSAVFTYFLVTIVNGLTVFILWSCIKIIRNITISNIPSHYKVIVSTLCLLIAFYMLWTLVDGVIDILSYLSMARAFF